MEADGRRSARLRGWVVVGGLGLMLGLLLAPAQASAAQIFIQPGHYVGHTTQTCSKLAAQQSGCQVGRKLPISFKLTQHTVSHLRTVVIEKCEGDPKSIAHVMDYSFARGLYRFKNGYKLFSYSYQDNADDVQDEADGFVKQATAYGFLQAFLNIKTPGESEEEGGTLCGGLPGLRWHARLKQSSGSPRARSATASSVLSPTSLAVASRSKLAFKPGHYVGHTNQTCTAKAAARGDCEAHKRLPISFTVTGSFVSHVDAIAITKCSGDHADYVHVLNYPKPSIIFTDPDRAFFFDLQAIIKQNMAATNDLVAGFLKGDKASGGLESFAILDSNGNLDPLGTTGCNSGRVRWHARLAG